jgi:putative endonuclease
MPRRRSCRASAGASRALDHFLARRPDLATLDRRFDVVLIAPRRWPRHVRDAWQGE